MGKILLVVSDKTEQHFRSVAMRAYGNRKGAISNAGDQALAEWARDNE